MRVIYLNKKENKEDEKNLIFHKKECCIKWFSLRDGYGFVSANTIPELKNLDIFLHYSKIDQNSRKLNIKPGDILICDISQGSKGPQVEKIYEYIPVNKSVSSLVKCHGIIKWFNLKDDFGFIKPIALIKQKLEESDEDYENDEGGNVSILDEEKMFSKEVLEEKKMDLLAIKEQNDDLEPEIQEDSDDSSDKHIEFGEKDIFIPGKKVMLMGIEKSQLVAGRKCICYFKIDDQNNKICEKLFFKEY